MYKEYNILKNAVRYSRNIASLLFITIHNNNIVIFTSSYVYLKFSKINYPEHT